MRRKQRAPFAALVVALAAVASAQEPRLMPVDDGPKDAAFLAFRTDLLQTIARRDVSALLRIVHPDIKNTFGDDNGIGAFERIWRPDQADSAVWKELGAVLALGGTFMGPDGFVAPYVHSSWPEAFDAFDHVALIGSNVRVRAAPGAHAGVLRTLSYSILRIKDAAGDQRSWIGVALPDGRTGYVASHLARSPIDYRAFFNRTEGRWLMTALVRGD